MQLPNFNPYNRAIKKYLIQAMPKKYTAQTDEIIDRITNQIVTKQDGEGLIRLLGDLYQAGYETSMESTQKALEKSGIKLNLRISQPKSPAE